ncbi:MAG: ribosomal-protein-alanine N-acetyltransferase [Arenicella sp.]|jgi:ribosomal-protein-alanine N-acetyltransferase
MGSLRVISKLKSLHLETQRLVIRPVLETDLESVYLIHKEPIVNRYVPYQTWLSFADAQAWYARVERRRKDTAEQFVILSKANSELLGTCIVFVHQSDNASFELGYVLAKTAWGHGYMCEALAEFIPAVAERLTLTSLMAVIEADNLRSIKLIGKLGFFESHRKQQGETQMIYFLRRFEPAKP